MAKPTPHIALCLSAIDQVMTDWAIGAMLMVQHTGYHLDIVCCRSALLHKNFNDMLDMVMNARAQGHPVTHILFMDTDMRIPDHALDTLVSRDVDIIGATYRRRSEPWDLLHREEGTPAGSGTVEMIERLADRAYIHNMMDKYGDIMRVEAIPTGLLLVTVEALETIMRASVHGKPFRSDYVSPFPDVPPGRLLTPDFWFSRRAKELGYDIWCDLTVSKDVGHIASTVIWG